MRAPRGWWDKYALQIAALRVGEFVSFLELPNDEASLSRMRTALSRNTYTKAIRVSVRPAELGVTVGNKGGEKKHCAPRNAPLVMVASPAAPAVVVDPSGKCSERACVFPAFNNGLCRQHDFWTKQTYSDLGSTLGPVTMAGV